MESNVEETEEDEETSHWKPWTVTEEEEVEDDDQSSFISLAVRSAADSSMSRMATLVAPLGRRAETSGDERR